MNCYLISSSNMISPYLFLRTAPFLSCLSIQSPPPEPLLSLSLTPSLYPPLREWEVSHCCPIPWPVYGTLSVLSLVVIDTTSLALRSVDFSSAFLFFLSYILAFLGRLFLNFSANSESSMSSIFSIQESFWDIEPKREKRTKATV